MFVLAVHFCNMSEQGEAVYADNHGNSYTSLQSGQWLEYRLMSKLLTC